VSAPAKEEAWLSAPKAGGFYWIRPKNKRQGKTVVLVFQDVDELLVAEPANEQVYPASEWPDFEWQGPLPEPE